LGVLEGCRFVVFLLDPNAKSKACIRHARKDAWRVKARCGDVIECDRCIGDRGQIRARKDLGCVAPTCERRRCLIYSAAARIIIAGLCLVATSGRFACERKATAFTPVLSRQLRNIDVEAMKQACAVHAFNCSAQERARFDVEGFHPGAPAER
jgi:hypothetical protein